MFYNFRMNYTDPISTILYSVVQASIDAEETDFSHMLPTTVNLINQAQEEWVSSIISEIGIVPSLEIMQFIRYMVIEYARRSSAKELSKLRRSLVNSLQLTYVDLKAASEQTQVEETLAPTLEPESDEIDIDKLPW